MTDSRHSIARRTILEGIVATGAVTILPGIASAAPDGSFRHGVASGDPDQTSVVLWTRVTADGPVDVEWELAATPTFSRRLAAGMVTTDAERDHTVKVLATGLQPGGRYYYRFRAAGVESPTGRTRTLPAGRVDQLGIALASCSNYAFGYFNAYEAIARDPAIDFVLHTGDYLYEYGAEGWGAEVARALGRAHSPAHEIVSLADYRQRHAQYKSDPGSQAMLARHPLLACWDDHESANNPWTGGAENHQPATEGDWTERRAASIRAYFEWMPVREPGPGRSRMQFWRHYRFGDLAMLHTLETRHTARALQIDYRDWAGRLKTREDADRLMREELGRPGRAMLAPELEDDLSRALRLSVRDGQPWRLIGNPMIIARTLVPDVARLKILPESFASPATAAEARSLAWRGEWNLPFFTDAWDGYPWARERLYALSREAGAGDLVFLSGDSHSFWANRLADSSGRPAGIELGTAGITSPGDFDSSGFDADVSRRLDQAVSDHCDEVVWTDNRHQGYVRLELTKQRGRATFVTVDVRNRRFRPRTLKTFALARSDGNVTLREA